MSIDPVGQRLAEIAKRHGRLTVLARYTDREGPWLATVAVGGQRASGRGESAFEAIANAIRHLT